MYDKNELKATTRGISNYRGLIISHRFLCVVLLAAQIFLLANHIKNFSALIILFAHVAFPFILTEILKGKAGKEALDESNLPMPLLRKKLRYSKISCNAYSGGFLFSILLLITWSVSSRSSEFEIVRGIPNTILGAFAAIRILIWIYYTVMFKFFPEKIIK